MKTLLRAYVCVLRLVTVFVQTRKF